MVGPDIDTMAMQLLQAVGLVFPLFLIAIQTLPKNLRVNIKKETEIAVMLLSTTAIFSLFALISPVMENALFNIGAILLAISFIFVAEVVLTLFPQ